MFPIKFPVELLPGRTHVQCMHRWKKVLDPQLVKGPWSKEVHLHLFFQIIHYLFEKYYKYGKKASVPLPLV
jgi:Myb-like DNA-binding domain